jgi:ATP-dependent RNA helicase DDX51/DBP6
MSSLVDQLRGSSSSKGYTKEKNQRGEREEEGIKKAGKRFFDDEDFYDGEAAGPTAPPPPPISVSASVNEWKVDSQFSDILMADGITQFSVVQRLVIPSLLRFNERKCIVPRDICVSAPTGSGKTIAYALPIMQTLYQQLQQHRESGMPVRLRALVLLPSRELAAQVFRVFCRLSKNNIVKVALASGQKPFEEEQRQLTGNYYADARKVLLSSIDLSFITSNRKYYQEPPCSHGNSTVDILVCTPGRLLEHLQHTIGFTLQHLRFLVLDEADTLLVR